MYALLFLVLFNASMHCVLCIRPKEIYLQGTKHNRCFLCSLKLLTNFHMISNVMSVLRFEFPQEACSVKLKSVLPPLGNVTGQGVPRCSEEEDAKFTFQFFLPKSKVIQLLCLPLRTPHATNLPLLPPFRLAQRP